MKITLKMDVFNFIIFHFHINFLKVAGKKKSATVLVSARGCLNSPVPKSQDSGWSLFSSSESKALF